MTVTPANTHTIARTANTPSPMYMPRRYSPFTAAISRALSGPAYALDPGHTRRDPPAPRSRAGRTDQDDRRAAVRPQPHAPRPLVRHLQNEREAGVHAH